MQSNRNKARRQSLMIAFCGMAAGLSIVIMLLGGVIPVATYAVPMLCGLLLLPILIEFGQGAAWATFFAAAALALLLDFDKLTQPLGLNIIGLKGGSHGAICEVSSQIALRP